MIEIGVQTKDVVYDGNPLEGFEKLKGAGFSCCDFSLNSYLTNKSLYGGDLNAFFNKSDKDLEAYFLPYKQAAKMAGIRINQMHMPYPNYVPGGRQELNNYLWNVMAPKSMKVCAFLECKYIVVHGFKLARYFGSEAAEWDKTSEFIESLALMAKELGITICVENIYTSIGKRIVEGPCCDAEKVAVRIDMMNDKYDAEVLGFCFDTGHANLVSIDFESFITTLGERLKVLHIHDNDGNGDLHQIPFTFTKTRDNKPSTDWDGFIRGLKKIKYDGVLSFETAPALEAFPDSMKQETLRFIANIGSYFKNKLLN